MEELRPLTVSNSTRSLPSVLLTAEMKKFVFVQPVNSSLVLAQNIYSYIHKHFKIESLSVGTFTLKGVKYMCSEAHQDIVELNPWLDYLWNSKSHYNRLFNPTSFFRICLINLYFPVFDTKKLLLLHKKDQFIVEAYPILKNGEGIFFRQKTLAETEMTRYGYRKLLRYMKNDLNKSLEEFEALHHDMLYTHLKYQVSLYPEIRNQYWEELKKCFNPDFRKSVHDEVRRYIAKL